MHSQFQRMKILLLLLSIIFLKCITAYTTSSTSKIYNTNKTRAVKLVEQLTLEGIKGEISAINGFDVKNSTLITKNDFVIRKTKSF